MIILTTDEPMNCDTLAVKQEQGDNIDTYSGSNSDGYLINKRCNPKYNLYKNRNIQVEKLKPLQVQRPIQFDEMLEESNTECLWVKSKSHLEKWVSAEDEPFAKKMCLRREVTRTVPLNNMCNAEYCTSPNEKSRALYNQFRILDQPMNGMRKEKCYSPPPIHVNSDQIKQQCSPTNLSSAIHQNSFHEISRDDSTRATIRPPKKRHADGFATRRFSGRPMCSDLCYLRGKHELDTPQKSSMEGFCKTYYDLTKSCVQEDGSLRLQHRETKNQDCVYRGSRPTHGGFTSHFSESEKEFSRRKGTLTSESNCLYNNKHCISPPSCEKPRRRSPQISSAEMQSFYQNQDQAPHSKVTGMCCSPEIKPKMLSPTKVGGSPCFASSSASPEEWKAESPNDWQQKKYEDESSGSSIPAREELLNLQIKYQQTPQPNFEWAEKEFSVKELRHLIPILILESFGLKSDPVTKKVKGIWDRAPEYWPSDVPYIDPNNGQKPTGKPKKDVLLKMFTYLLDQYITKVAREATSARPYNDSTPINVTQVKSSSVISRGSSSREPSMSPSSATSCSSLSTVCDRSMQYDTECDTNKGVSLAPEHTVNRNRTTVTQQQSYESSIERPSHQNSNGHKEPLRGMPALIPISEIIQLKESEEYETFHSKSIMPSNSVKEHNELTQVNDLVTSTVKSPAVKALTFEPSVTPEEDIVSSPQVQPSDKPHVSTTCPDVSVNESNRQQSEGQVTKTSWGSPTTQFRGMKARILSCVNNDQKPSSVDCDSSRSSTHQAKTSENQEKTPTALNQNDKNISNNTNKEVKATDGPKPLNAKANAVIVQRQRTSPDSDDVINTCGPGAGGFRPLATLYSRIKEKVYYIHWAGWLADDDVRILYDVLDQLKAMKQVAADSDNREELHIEFSHLFESILDVVMLRRAIKMTQITILKHLKKQIYDSLSIVQILH